MFDTSFKRGKILSYDSSNRTAQVHIHGLTDGASEGITATFAYGIGEDDRDTELKIMVNDSPDVFVFFESGDHASPVICFFSSHGSGNIQDIRRIRQKNIEILAEQNINIKAQTINITAQVNFKGKVTFDGDIDQQNGTINTPDVVVNGKSTAKHTHTDSRNGATSTMK